MDDKRTLLRHFLAALAYRTQKAVHGAPEGFGSFDAGNGARTPKDTIRHMTGVLWYARSLISGGPGRPEPAVDLEAEIKGFHAMLEDLGRSFDSGEPPQGATLEQILQGPLADAMTHAGQLALLRRLAGAPVAGENFVKADIRPDNLGPDQPLQAGPESD